MKEKITYLEHMRVLATLAVVMIHIVMTLNNNYTIADIGTFNYTVFSDCYMLVKWAVPCFLMISGTLLLNPKKEIDVSKIKSYIGRMFLVLVTFGFGYALMELVFNEKTISIKMILDALLNTAQRNSWDHMWYIYVLIGLYILTIPIKCFINNQPRKNLKLLLAVLIVGNFVIPTLNTIFNISLDDYMIFNQYVTYYILGYYLSTCDEKKIGYKSAIVFVATALIMVISETISLYTTNSELKINHTSNGIFTLVLASSLFLFVKYLCNTKDLKITKFAKTISYCSFGVYLIHPFWINLLYKLVGVTPVSMPIGIGIIVLFVVVLALSIVSTLIIKKIPFIKNIV